MTASSVTNPNGSTSTPPVLLVSLDGIAPRFVSPERMPNLCGLVRSGAGCFTGRTVDPPWTRPAHASMLLGVDPVSHGIVDNSMSPVTTDARSLLAVARAAGRSTASVNNWRQLDTLIEPDASLHRLFIDSGYDPTEDERMVDLVEALLRSHRPDVMFVYLCRTDLSGHEHGWGSPEYLDAMTRIDATLGRLLTSIGDDASIVVTTDHGGVGTNHAATTDDVMDVFVAVRSARVRPGSMWVESSTLDIAPTVVDLAGLEPDPHWQGTSLIGRERPMADHVLDLLRESDRHHYGEQVTMLEHALQSAAAIVSAPAGGPDGPADDELVLAALLHDLGHLAEVSGDHGDPDHAETGAAFLRPWLPATVVEPIRLHVAAKRHLVGADPAYAEALSEASRITLADQGGPFNGEESEAFLSLPHAERAMRLRRCDDLGKRPDAEIALLEDHRDRIAAALATPPIDPTWARDACRCAACRDTVSGQHLIDVTGLAGWTVLGSRRCDTGLQVDLVRPNGGRHVAWIPDRSPTPARLAVPWSTDYAPTVRHAADTDAIATDVARDGLSVVTGIAPVDGEVLRFASTLGFVRETNYGRHFDVRVEPAAINLAYTPLGLPLHTDNPYRDPTPTVQVLHCLVPAVSGGTNLLVDGLAAAERLRRADPAAFEALATTLVRFRFESVRGDAADVDLVAERTVIELRADGSVAAVAVNHRSLDTACDTSFADALAMFARLLDEMAIEVGLAAGEAIVFDNRRVLHARTAYDPGAGRHLQGCYIDIDALASTARRASVRTHGSGPE